MSEARIEILRLLAEGKITPEEAERLLDALGPSPEGGPRQEGGSSGGGEGQRTGRFGEGVAQVFEEVGETVRRAIEDVHLAAHRLFEEHRSGTEAIEIREGAFTIPPGAHLKVQQAVRVSFGGGSRGGNVILRSSSAGAVRVLRGEAVEAHRNGSDYGITWAKGNLELEIPRTLAGLEVRCLGGDLEVSGFPGPMSLETMGGELRVQSPRSPIRCRTLGGKVRIADLELREGSSVISSTGGNVQVVVSPQASITIRVTTLGGGIEFPPGSETNLQGRPRRRAACVINEGIAELRIDTLGGDVRVRADG